MERLEGHDLAKELNQRGTLGVEEAVDHILQACEGLAEAHAAGIVHRDLKPENLFLAETPEGRLLKILDFGISKDFGPATRLGPRTVMTDAGCSVGSPYYMSPEQMRGSAAVDARADIWSLGAILYELLTGSCPFDGESIPVVCSNVLNIEPPDLPNLELEGVERVQAVIRCCLQKDASARFDSVGELAAALREFGSQQGRDSADRSLRFASGVDLKREKVARCSSTPVTLVSRSAACSSPALPARATPRVSPPSDLGATTGPRRATLWLAIALSTATLAMLGGSWVRQTRSLQTLPAQVQPDADSLPAQVQVTSLAAVESQPAGALTAPVDTAVALALPTSLSTSARVVTSAKPPHAFPRFAPRQRSAAYQAPAHVPSAAAIAVTAAPAPAPSGNVASPAAASAPSSAASSPSRSAWQGDRLGGRY
jgi:serine/threonine-protein kinase